MKKLTVLLIIVTIMVTFSAFPQKSTLQKKQDILRSVEKHQKELIMLSDDIWNYAETALMEHKSSKALADYAEAQGFKVERNVADLPTAFIASYGQANQL